jgi:hypothetical protein
MMGADTEKLPDVWALHEPVVTRHPPKPVADVFDIHLLMLTHPRDVPDEDGEEDDPVMDGSIVLEVV